MYAFGTWCAAVRFVVQCRCAPHFRHFRWVIGSGDGLEFETLVVGGLVFCDM